MGRDEHPEKSRVTNLEDWIKGKIHEGDRQGVGTGE